MPAIILPSSDAYDRITRKELRRMVGEDVGGDLFITGQVMDEPEATPDTFSMEEFVDFGVDSSRWIDWWVLIEEEERRLVEVRPESGEVKLHRPLGEAPAPGTIVEVYRWRPSLFNKAINDGLARCKYVQWVQVEMESNAYEYNLSSVPWVLSRQNLLGVYLRYEDDQSDVPWSDLRFDGSSRTLTIRPSTWGSGVTLWIKTKRSYGPLLSDAEAVSMPELWARSAVRLALFELLLARSGSGKENAWLRGAYNQARAYFRRQSDLYMPREARKLQMSAPVWGPTYI
jgi:hypothetical protein